MRDVEIRRYPVKSIGHKRLAGTGITDTGDPRDTENDADRDGCLAVGATVVAASRMAVGDEVGVS